MVAIMSFPDLDGAYSSSFIYFMSVIAARTA